jgi:hypothetical protein
MLKFKCVLFHDFAMDQVYVQSVIQLHDQLIVIA